MKKPTSDKYLTFENYTFPKGTVMEYNRWEKKCRYENYLYVLRWRKNKQVQKTAEETDRRTGK